MYTQLVTLHHDSAATRSPIVFVHGFPDSRLMFDAYHTDDERQKAWLAGRSIYAIEFPNRHTNDAAFPTWRYIRDGGHDTIEKIVSCSVGASFRYDVWDQGMRAFGWLYALLFSLPYYFSSKSVRAGIAQAIVDNAGYQSDTANDLYIDAYHYWDGPLWLYRILYRSWVPRRDYTDFRFPVLYIRSPQDRLASNAAFERTLTVRDDCTILIWEDANHWFPEQQSQRVLTEVRPFLE